jgi:carbamoyl-phosphate synthase large subunit
MKQFTLLMLGGGKRVSLLQRFEEASVQLGLDFRAFAYELNDRQPISQLAKVIVGKRWLDEEIEEDLMNISKCNKVDLIVSNVDQATLVQSRIRKSLKAASFSSILESAEICLSKKRFQSFCHENNLGIIPLAIDDEYPVFAKPNFGSASEGAVVVSSKSEKDSLAPTLDFIIQKYVKGVEYSVDAYVSRNGKICGVSPRRRLRTLGGESVETETLYDAEIFERTCQVIKKLHLVGPLTIQFIREDVTQRLYLLEVNPRFGGGVIASIEAGFNFPLMMLEECIGIEPRVVLEGKKIRMIRYFKEVFYEDSD